MSINLGSGGARLGATVSGPSTVTGYSVGGWVYLKANVLSCWASLAYGAGSDTLQIIYDGALRAQVQSNGSFVNAAVGFPGIAQWFHWALTWDGSSATLFANGVAGTPQSLSAGAGQSWTALTVGFSTFSSNAYVQDAFFYSTALTQQEIRAQMTQRQILRSDALEAWYPILGGATRNLDYSGNKRNATGVGTLSDGDINAPVGWRGMPARRLYVAPAAGGAIVGSGVVLVAGAASLSSAASVSAAGTVRATGAASLSGAASAAGSGLVLVTGSAVVSAASTGQINAFGAVQTTGTASLTAAATLVASGVVRSTGVTTVTAGLSAVSSTLTTGSASLGLTLPIIATGSVQVTGVATVTAPLGIAAAGTALVTGTSQLAAAASVSPIGIAQVTGAASISASTGLAALGVARVTGSGVVAASAPLTAAGGTVLVNGTATAAMTAVFPVSAAGVTRCSGIALVSGGVPVYGRSVGQLSTSARRQFAASERRSVRRP